MNDKIISNACQDGGQDEKEEFKKLMAKAKLISNHLKDEDDLVDVLKSSIGLYDNIKSNITKIKYKDHTDLIGKIIEIKGRGIMLVNSIRFENNLDEWILRGIILGEHRKNIHSTTNMVFFLSDCWYFNNEDFERLFECGKIELKTPKYFKEMFVDRVVKCTKGFFSEIDSEDQQKYLEMIAEELIGRGISCGMPTAD